MLAEAEASSQPASDMRETSSALSRGATTDIAVLSKLALKEAVLELETKLRNFADASSDVVLSAWHQAERQMGVEVHIEDPAIRNMFGLHVVAVEDLCHRLRSQAEATLAAAEIWNEPHLSVVACDLKLLSQTTGIGAVQALDADLAEAATKTSAVYERLASRIETEVLNVLDTRLQQHERLRQTICTRQRWRNNASAAGRDVARLHQGAQGESGLLALDGHASASPVRYASGRLRDSALWIAKLDEEVLTGLMDMQSQSVDVVRKPWAALVQIQAEFYCAQQALWAPMALSFEEFSRGGQATGVR